MEETSSFRYAGFWVRVGAFLIDLCVIIALCFLLGVVLGILGVNTGRGNEVSEGGLNLLVLLLIWLYNIIMLANFRATLGKMATGIIVVSDTGENLPLGRIIIRETIGRLIAGIILWIGYLMISWTKRKQGLHDKIASSVVVHKY